MKFFIFVQKILIDAQKSLNLLKTKIFMNRLLLILLFFVICDSSYSAKRRPAVFNHSGAVPQLALTKEEPPGEEPVKEEEAETAVGAETENEEAETEAGKTKTAAAAAETLKNEQKEEEQEKPQAKEGGEGTENVALPGASLF